MQSRPGFAGGDFRCECYIEFFLGGKIADCPFGQHKLVGGIACIDRQELDFILLVDFTVESEVPDFAVSVFDLSAGCCYGAHAFAAEVVEFGIGRALVVAALVGGGEETRVAGYHVEFKLAHGMECQAGSFGELLAGFGKGMFRRACQRVAVLVEEGAEHGEGRNGGEGIDEGCAESRHYIQVGAAGLYEGE